MSLLELSRVSYRYEGSSKETLNEINIGFEKGRIYTIVGKSGAGKSTLLYLLAGLDVASSGVILYQHENLANLNRNRFRARQAGIVFQGLNLLTNASAVDNIVLSMNISGISGIDKRAEAYDLLDRLGISKEKASRPVLKLSGGDQQRVAIARALAHNPQLVIADEPTGNIDKETEASILKIFTRLAKEEGRCVIIVTHSRRVSTIADEVWEIDKGTLRKLSTSIR